MTSEGWKVLILDFPSSLRETHVFPLNDFRLHQDEDCWCGAKLDDENMLVHKSADGREEYEQGRKVS